MTTTLAAAGSRVVKTSGIALTEVRAAPLPAGPFPFWFVCSGMTLLELAMVVVVVVVVVVVG